MFYASPYRVAGFLAFCFVAGLPAFREVARLAMTSIYNKSVEQIKLISS